MIDFLAWWSQYMTWIRTITTLAFFSLILIAVLYWFLGGNGKNSKVLGCILTDIILLIVATYLYDNFGLEILFPEVFSFFDNLFNGGFM